VQEVDASAVEMEPAAHGVQSLASSWSDLSVAASVLYFPGAQDEHSRMDPDDAYLPMAQMVHCSAAV
jgi:hypothetical protein